MKKVLKQVMTANFFKQCESWIGGSKRKKVARVHWNRYLKVIFS